MLEATITHKLCTKKYAPFVLLQPPTQTGSGKINKYILAENSWDLKEIVERKETQGGVRGRGRDKWFVKKPK